MNYRSVGNFKTYLFKASFISVSLCTDLLEAFLIKYTNRMIKGKNKKQFEKWYELNDYEYDLILFDFYTLPFEMQLGVYLAYYDFKDVFVLLVKGTIRQKSYGVIIIIK